MPRNLPHIFGRVFNTPLAIPPVRLDPLLVGLHAASLQRGSANGDDDDDEDNEQDYPGLPEIAVDDAPEWDRSTARDGYAISPQGVAWLPIRGIMVKREGEINADSTEFESYARIGATLRACIADVRVRAILLDVDSCGGEVGGLFDLAQDIRTASTIKPVWAIANDDALSAGYALASATSRVIVTKVAGVGSVGVVAMHTDQSGFDAAAGLVYSYIYAGEHKIDGNAHEPLAEDARATIQAEVDRIYGMFVNMVALHRGLSAAAVRATQAGVFYGPDAITAGFADQLGTLPQAVAALGDVASGPRRVGIMTENTPTPTGAVAGDTPLNASVLNEVQQELTEAVQGATVVRLDAVRQATQNVRREVKEITSLCILAGFPQLAPEFIDKETPLHAVRADLEQRRAAADQAAQVQTVHTAPDPKTEGPSSEMSKVLTARWASQMGRN